MDFNQSEAVSQVDEVEKIPQKVAGVQAGEDEKGCNYSLTCELCQKENKTLQSLYTHVIVHIRVELERKVKDLMEGFQCKVLLKFTDIYNDSFFFTVQALFLQV